MIIDAEVNFRLLLKEFRWQENVTINQLLRITETRRHLGHIGRNVSGIAWRPDSGPSSFRGGTADSVTIE